MPVFKQRGFSKQGLACAKAFKPLNAERGITGSETEGNMNHPPVQRRLLLQSQRAQEISSRPAQKREKH
ncbi:hypothetical protein BEN74_08775 [Acinetobacter sp. WCHAc010034]|nr:hypothetical protein BEN74_08775 [Acinetobacter sp. WCHAc010034]